MMSATEEISNPKLLRLRKTSFKFQFKKGQDIQVQSSPSVFDVLQNFKEKFRQFGFLLLLYMSLPVTFLLKQICIILNFYWIFICNFCLIIQEWLRVLRVSVFRLIPAALLHRSVTLCLLYMPDMRIRSTISLFHTKVVSPTVLKYFSCFYLSNFRIKTLLGHLCLLTQQNSNTRALLKSARYLISLPSQILIMIISFFKWVSDLGKRWINK